jgi:hypothetical protein
MPSKLRTALAALALLAAAGLAAPAEAAMHCGHKIVSRGDPAAKLERFCGKPATVEKRLALGTYATKRGLLLPGFVEEVWVEEWTYNFGPHKLMRLVRVENGVVTNVRILGRGF